MTPMTLASKDLPVSRCGALFGRAVLAASALLALALLEPRLLTTTLAEVAAGWKVVSSLAFVIGQWGAS